MRRTTSFVSAVAVAALSAGALVATAGSGAAASTSAFTGKVSANVDLAVGPARSPADLTQSGCKLGNGVKHVFYLGFDNFHLRRDDSNSVANDGDDNKNTDTDIPSDLEEVPALYNFLRGSSTTPSRPNASTADNASYADGRNIGYSDGTGYPGGTLLGNEHTPLIAHTSGDFTTTYTGVYGDRHGIATTQNSVAAYQGSTTAPVKTQSAFSYWTDPLNLGNDTTPILDAPNGSGGGVNAPAPWVPFTRAGCDVGAVSTTGMVAENQTSINTLFGSTPTGKSAVGDLEGIAVHCATDSPFCATAAGDTNSRVVTETLPAEPNGYAKQAVFGNTYVAPALNDRINGSTTGGTTSVQLLHTGLQPNTTASAFPGFNGEDGNYTLGYTLAMQKAGIPVTFGYLTTAHNCYSNMYQDYSVPESASSGTCNYTDASGTAPTGSSSAFGSGEQGYTNYLSNLNTDFQTFFDQTKAAGYTTANTEFVFYSDESDHEAEATPSNGTGATPCDGVTTACGWTHAAVTATPPANGGQLGELTIKANNFPAIAPSGSATTAPYFLNADSAPEFYTETTGNAAPPAQTDPKVRTLERNLATTTYPDPFTGSSTAGSQTQIPIAKYQADQAELGALHMVTADPLRTPTFVSFANGEDYVENSPNDCGSVTTATCANSGFVGIHGDYAPETDTTWAGFAGPGVRNVGLDTTDWTEHVDIRPTLLQLLGLTDDYTTDGRVITQIVQPGTASAPASLTDPKVSMLGMLQKRLNAPVYESAEGAMDGFGTATLAADTSALKSGSGTDDSLFTTVEADITLATAERNAVVADIDARLTAASSGTSIDPAAAAKDTAQGNCLVAYANALKAYAAAPAANQAPTDCNAATAVAALPEASHSALLVLAAGLVIGGGLLVAGRRRRAEV